MHINKHFCQYARVSQMAIFHLQSLEDGKSHLKESTINILT